MYAIVGLPIYAIVGLPIVRLYVIVLSASISGESQAGCMRFQGFTLRSAYVLLLAIAALINCALPDCS